VIEQQNPVQELDDEEVRLLEKRARPGFRVVCATVEATGEIIAGDLKRLNKGLLAAAKQVVGRPHCPERIVAPHFK
jgi:hypothetical protein